jgi:hypothetical protein
MASYLELQGIDPPEARTGFQVLRAVEPTSCRAGCWLTTCDDWDLGCAYLQIYRCRCRIAGCLMFDVQCRFSIDIGNNHPECPPLPRVRLRLRGVIYRQRT